MQLSNPIFLRHRILQGHVGDLIQHVGCWGGYFSTGLVPMVAVSGTLLQSLEIYHILK